LYWMLKSICLHYFGWRLLATTGPQVATTGPQVATSGPQVATTGPQVAAARPQVAAAGSLWLPCCYLG